MISWKVIQNKAFSRKILFIEFRGKLIQNFLTRFPVFANKDFEKWDFSYFINLKVSKFTVREWLLKGSVT